MPRSSNSQASFKAQSLLSCIEFQEKTITFKASQQKHETNEPTENSQKKTAKLKKHVAHSENECDAYSDFEVF